MYHYIQTNKELQDAIPFLVSQPVLGLDTETTGLDPHVNRIRLIQIGTLTDGIMVDLFSVTDLSPLQPLWDDPNLIWVGQHLKFDLGMLMGIGVTPLGKFFDTEVASQLLTAGIKQKHSLAALSQRYLQEPLDKSQQRSDWSYLPLSESQLRYAADDVIATLKLRRVLRERLVDAGLVQTALIEFGAIPGVAAMEYSGITLATERWAPIAAAMVQAESGAKAELLARIPPQPTQQISLFGDTPETDLNSNPTMLRILKQAGINVPSTGKEVLESIDHPLPKALVRYRKASKLVSTYGSTLPTHINPVTGRIHPTYWQIGAASGRFSCSEPNLQNIPRSKEIRNCFVPGKGNVFVIADYSQMQLRIAAQIAQDEAMINAYQKGWDLHRLSVRSLVSVPMEEMTKEHRQKGKAVNFGFIFGMAALGFVDYARDSYGVIMSVEEAIKFRDAWFDLYQGILAWHTRTNVDVWRHKKSGEPMVTRSLTGRLRHLTYPKLTEALNTPVQGTEADIVKLAIGMLMPGLRKLGGRLVGQIHDEIIIEVPEALAQDGCHILETAMVSAGERWLPDVPVVAETNVALSWADK